MKTIKRVVRLKDFVLLRRKIVSLERNSLLDKAKLATHYEGFKISNRNIYILNKLETNKKI